MGLIGLNINNDRFIEDLNIYQKKISDESIRRAETSFSIITNDTINGDNWEKFVSNIESVAFNCYKIGANDKSIECLQNIIQHAKNKNIPELESKLLILMAKTYFQIGFPASKIKEKLNEAKESSKKENSFIQYDIEDMLQGLCFLQSNHLLITPFGSWSNFYIKEEKMNYKK